ncbi:hypothetical protein [Caproicibacter sp. BJN0012]|uniref:hypothetical protein n=1 Tax=Caproicibacter sp. BJN0012 TaxID=3110227 RepID=UPI002E10B3B3
MNLATAAAAAIVTAATAAATSATAVVPAGTADPNDNQKNNPGATIVTATKETTVTHY